MKKITKNQVIEQQENEIMILELCQAICKTRNLQSASDLLTDLLSPAELKMIARRLKIASELIDGKKYREIKCKIGVGDGTIAKINAWLLQSGAGFKQARNQLKNNTGIRDLLVLDDPMNEWTKLGNKYKSHHALNHFFGNKKERDEAQRAMKRIKTKKISVIKRSNNNF